MTDKEAMKLALEFIERVNKDGWILADFEPQMYEAITALKERLAQEKALQALHNENERLGLYKDAYAQPDLEQLLFHKGTSMTDKEAMKLALEALELLTDTEQTFGALDYGDNAITALKKRLADPMREVQRLGQEIEQEPDWKDGVMEQQTETILWQAKRIAELIDNPPQRTWVWLTDEEHQKIINAHFSAQEMLIAAETKSKEKNFD